MVLCPRSQASVTLNVGAAQTVAVAVSCSPAFLDAFRSELSLRSNISTDVLPNVTCTQAGGGAARRQMLQASPPPLPSPPPAACAAGAGGLNMTLVLRVPPDNTTAPLYRQRLLDALKAWEASSNSNSGSNSSAGGLVLCATPPARVVTSSEVACSRRWVAALQSNDQNIIDKHCNKDD